MNMAIAGALGFLTIPAMALVIAGIVGSAKFAGTYNLASQHYWGGFFVFIAVAVAFIASMAFWAD